MSSLSSLHCAQCDHTFKKAAALYNHRDMHAALKHMTPVRQAEANAYFERFAANHKKERERRQAAAAVAELGTPPSSPSFSPVSPQPPANEPPPPPQPALSPGQRLTLTVSEAEAKIGETLKALCLKRKRMLEEYNEEVIAVKRKFTPRYTELNDDIAVLACQLVSAADSRVVEDDDE